jgi:hypothetical protein
VLFLSVTSLVVPESSGLSSPVRDSRESTHSVSSYFFLCLHQLMAQDVVRPIGCLEHFELKSSPTEELLKV